MENKKYNIRYLHITKRDITEIIDYIAFDLKVINVAITMLNTIESSILTLRQNPYRGAILKSERKHNPPYRMLVIKNYIVFYIILDDTVEIQRVIYNRKDFNKIFK